MPDSTITALPDLARYHANPRLGRVISVSGGRVIMMLDDAADQLADTQVGTLVKIARPDTHCFGIVEALSTPMPRQQPGESESRLAEISLMGELAEAPGAARMFRRGVSNLPCLDDPVLAASSDDTATVYAMPQRQAVRIGTVHQDPSVGAHVSVDDLLGRHFAIVGATGSGKSCALALLLQGIIQANPNGHVLLLDPHGEYGQAFGDRAEAMSVDRLRLPYWILEFEELVEILFGAEKDTMASEAAALRQLVLRARLSYAQEKCDAAAVTVDTPTPYTLTELNYLLEQEIGRLNSQATLAPLLRLKARLGAAQTDPRYAFLFPNDLVLRDDLAAIIGQLFRVPTHGKPLCTLDLSGVSSEILNVVVAVLCRLAFNLAVAIGQRVPLLLVCEEAHRYAPQDTALGFEPAKRSLARIAKEGRKYGISLGLLSQRPSELAASILSQCSTMLAFRMTNHADQEMIQAALSEVSPALVSSLPLLGNGEAVIVGEGVAVPMRLRLSQLPPDRRPRSHSARFSRLWQQEDVTADTLLGIVDDWRGGGPASRRPHWLTHGTAE